MCHIEPYATQALMARPGAVKLSDGTDVYGPGYTDCVLAVRDDLLTQNPKAVKALIKGLLVAQQQSELDRPAAVQATVGTYFKASVADTLDASTKQPNVVDQRGKAQFMLDRGAGLKDLGYLKNLPDKNIFDWTLLDQVIQENQELYHSLQRAAA
jgi:NitT/TauT family transport system substrate-binding protein